MRNIFNGLVLALSIGISSTSIIYTLESKKQVVEYRAAYWAMQLNSEALARTRFGAIDTAFVCKFKN